MFHEETKGMGADIMGDVMRNGTFCHNRMLGHRTCTHIQATLVLLHTKQQVVLYNLMERTIKFPGCCNKPPDIKYDCTCSNPLPASY